MAVPACTRTRSHGLHRADQGDVDGLEPRAVRTSGGAGVDRGRRTSPMRPSSEQVMQAASSSHSLGRCGEQARVLEADVGELPQHVVQQHQATVMDGGAVSGSVVHKTWSAAPASRPGRRRRARATSRPTPGPVAWRRPRPARRRR